MKFKFYFPYLKYFNILLTSYSYLYLCYWHDRTRYNHHSILLEISEGCSLLTIIPLSLLITLISCISGWSEVRILLGSRDKFVIIKFTTKSSCIFFETIWWTISENLNLIIVQFRTRGTSKFINDLCRRILFRIVQNHTFF